MDECFVICFLLPHLTLGECDGCVLSGREFSVDLFPWLAQLDEGSERKGTPQNFCYRAQVETDIVSGGADGEIWIFYQATCPDNSCPCVIKG